MSETIPTYSAADLLDTPPEKAFDRVTSLVSKLLDVPVAIVSIIDEDRQFFKSEVGLSPPWSEVRETPLSHSFCQHVVRTERPLVVNNARQDPVVKANLAIDALGVEAYLGVPIHAADGTVIGSLCAIDKMPRAWSQVDRDLMCDLAEIIDGELALRDEVRRRREAEARNMLLLREMEHRIKNSVATVQAIVGMSLREGDDLETLRTTIMQRLASLARTQSLLVSVDRQLVSLIDILEAELRHFLGPDRLRMSGTDVQLAAADAVTLGMIAHELGTNAAKYGAIAKGGALRLQWQEWADEDGRRLRFEWTEAGVEISKAPSRTGFGSRLLDALVIRQHNGTIRRNWNPDGLHLVAELSLVSQA